MAVIPSVALNDLQKMRIDAVPFRWSINTHRRGKDMHRTVSNLAALLLALCFQTSNASVVETEQGLIEGVLLLPFLNQVAFGKEILNFKPVSGPGLVATV